MTVKLVTNLTTGNRIGVIFVVMVEEEVGIVVIVVIMGMMVFRFLRMTARQATYRIRRRELLAISSNIITVT